MRDEYNFQKKSFLSFTQSLWLITVVLGALYLAVFERPVHWQFVSVILNGGNYSGR